MAFPERTQYVCQTGQTTGKEFPSGGPVVASLPRAVPGADPGDVARHVIGEVEDWPNPDDLVRIVEVRRQYRHVRRLGDLPEAGLPALDRFAGAFRREAEPELLSLGNK